MEQIKSPFKRPFTEAELLGGWAGMVVLAVVSVLMRTMSLGMAVVMALWPIMLIAVMMLARCISAIGGDHGR